MEGDALAQMWLDDGAGNLRGIHHALPAAPAAADLALQDRLDTSLFDALAPGVPSALAQSNYAMPKGISSAPSSPEPKQPAATRLPRNASSLDGAPIRDSDAFTAEFGPGFTPFPAGGAPFPTPRAQPASPGGAEAAGSAQKRPLEQEEPRDFGDATAAALLAPAASARADLQPQHAQPAAHAQLPEPLEPAVPHTLPGTVSETLTFQQGR